MASVYIFFIDFYMDITCMCRLWGSYRLFEWMTLWTPTMINLRGFTIHPCVWIFSISELYLSLLAWMA